MKDVLNDRKGNGSVSRVSGRCALTFWDPKTRSTASGTVATIKSGAVAVKSWIAVTLNLLAKHQMEEYARDRRIGKLVTHPKATAT